MRTGSCQVRSHVGAVHPKLFCAQKKLFKTYNEKKILCLLKMNWHPQTLKRGYGQGSCKPNRFTSVVSRTVSNKSLILHVTHGRTADCAKEPLTSEQRTWQKISYKLQKPPWKIAHCFSQEHIITEFHRTVELLEREPWSLSCRDACVAATNISEKNKKKHDHWNYSRNWIVH